MKTIIENIEKFRKERNWDETDNANALAKSIIIEAGELLENFQWGEESMDRENVKEEIADVLIYTITLAELMGFDIEKIINEKLEKNIEKYPPKK